MELVCFSCQKVNQVSDKISYREECFHCKTDLHSCKNCYFYDHKSYNECKEPSADVVKEKERANFCDFYRPSQRGALIDEKASLKAAAEALFKKK
ncbi:MAG: hypothetical protein ACK4VO_08260 [Pseudobdellovibrio sp.]